MTSVRSVTIKGDLKRLWIDGDRSVKNHVNKIRAKFNWRCKNGTNRPALLVNVVAMCFFGYIFGMKIVNYSAA